MASELKVDKFTGVTTAGSILVTGEGNSTTTSLQQGLAKVWIAYALNTGSPVVADSFNVSGTTDNAAGDTTYAFSNNMATARGYTVSGKMAPDGDTTQNLTNNMSNSNFSGNCNAGLSNNRYALWSTLGTGTMPILSFRRGSSNSTADDASGITTQIAGDLA